jgi:group I intron endonuclease
MEAHIYLVTNNLSNMQYVGQTIDCKNKYGHGTLLARAYKKHSRKNFTYERICSQINDRHLLNYLERFWIATFNTIVPNGYNIESGGQDTGEGLKHSEETKSKLSFINSGEKHPFFGKRHSEETKQKIKNSMMGRKHTNEAKENMRAAIRPKRKRNDLGRFI